MINLLDFPYNLIGTLDEPAFMPLQRVPDLKEENSENHQNAAVEEQAFTQPSDSIG